MKGVQGTDWQLEGEIFLQVGLSECELPQQWNGARSSGSGNASENCGWEKRKFQSIAEKEYVGLKCSYPFKLGSLKESWKSAEDTDTFPPTAWLW